MLSFIEERKDTFVNDLSSQPYCVNVKHDTDSGLYITKHCYASLIDSSVVKDCNGTIITESGDIACYTGYSPILTTMSHFDGVQSALFPNYSCTEMIDGTVIRLFFHNDEWNVATRNHTDAGKCRWNSTRTFRELWNECLEKYEDFHTDLLDTSMTYMFVIQHPDNEQIIKVETPVIYLIDVYDNTTLTRLEPIMVDDTLNAIFPRPKLFDFKTVRDMSIFLTLDDDTIKGIVMHPDTDAIEDDTIYYLMTTAYENAMGKHVVLENNELFRSRSHTPIYSVFKNKQLEYNTNFNVGLIHHLYTLKYVQRSNVTTAPEHDVFLIPIHAYYKRNDRRKFGEGRCIINRYMVENLMYVIDETFGKKLLSNI